jgi:hypothetical protein
VDFVAKKSLSLLFFRVLPWIPWQKLLFFWRPPAGYALKVVGAASLAGMQVTGFGQAQHMAAVQTPEHTCGGNFAGDVVADILVLQLLGQLQGVD